MHKRLAAAAAILMTSGAAQAQGPGFVDLYVVPSAKLEVAIPGFGSGDDDGDGFGIRGLIPASESLAITGEYQSTSYDDSGIDMDQLRFGIGLTGPTTSGVYLEYISSTIDDADADGFGVHGRLSTPASQPVGVYGQIGYVALEDDFETNSGIEFSVGLAFQVNDAMGIFVDLRKTSLEGEDSEIEIDFTDFRAGLRISI